MAKNDFLEAIKGDGKVTTLNGAVTNPTTFSNLLDFFASGAALRNRSEEDIVELFSKAYAESANYAMKALFYIRDVRGGQGERRTFRTILKWLAVNDHAALAKMAHLVPEYGRWDDLIDLITPAKAYDGDEDLGNIIAGFVHDQLIEDANSDHPSLCAKWMPSINTSSKKTRKQAIDMARIMGVAFDTYRKMLSKIRRQIGIVEQQMSAAGWSGIEYDKIPSRASSLYAKAFRKHDEDRYGSFIEAVKKGEKKINASTLYPYEIIKAASKGHRPELDALWNALPNYVDEPENALVVCDTSGSMMSAKNRNIEPIFVATSLAMYFAERNTGIWQNYFITFSNVPELQEIVGNNVSEKFMNLRDAEWNMNTDFEAVFKMILDAAKSHKLPDSKMVKKLYVISDMEFDKADGDFTNFDAIKKAYKKCGYTMPRLVFWNVDAKQTQFPVTMNDEGVFLVSGCSPSILKHAVNSKCLGAADLMLEVLGSKRYDRIHA